MKVFFSYGHDQHADFIKKIKTDLKKNYNIDVWIDSEELKAKNDWEVELENAITNSDEIVFFITPYSSRRPDGYCLNELAFSISNNKDITPIMVDYITPPLSICRIQYIDIQNLVDKFDNDTYENFLSNLANVLNHKGTLSTEGQHTNFLDSLNPIDFSIDIQKHLLDFIGREWLYDNVNDLLKEDYKLLWIKAKAGFGKTAFSTMLQYKHPNAVGIHYCQFDSTRRKSAINVLKTLIFQLSTQIVEYKDIISNFNLNDLHQKDENTILEEFLLEPLNRIEKKESYFFIIDALDESIEDGKNKLADILNKFVDLPSWLKIVITSRPEPYLSRKLSSFKTLEIDTTSDENKADLLLYINKNINSKKLQDFNIQELTNKLIENSEGNILYLKEVINNINEGIIYEKNILNLPKGMDGLYLDMFERYFQDLKEYKSYQRPLFELMVSSNEAICFNFIINILDLDEYDIEDTLEPIGSIVEIKNETIKFFHKSISDWITDRDKAGRSFFVSKKKGQEKILDFVMDNSIKVCSKLLTIFSEGVLILNILYDHCFKLIEDNLFEEAKIVLEKSLEIRKLLYKYPSNSIHSGLKKLIENKYSKIKDIVSIEKNNYLITKTLSKTYTSLQDQYILALRDYSYILTETGHFKESIIIQKELISKLESIYLIDKDKWLLYYASTMNELAKQYSINGEMQKSLTLDESCLKLLDENTTEDDTWNELYVNTLSSLAMSYANIAETKKALELESKAKNFIENLYKIDNEKWIDPYLKCLNNYSISLKDTNNTSLALELETEALKIIEEQYDLNPSLWVNKYTLILNNLAYTYKIIGIIEKSIVLEKKALELSKLQYEKYKGYWSHVYLKSMLNLALSYKNLWMLNEAVDLENEVVEISKTLYSQNPSRWSDVYTRGLNSLAITLSKTGDYNESFELEKRSLNIRQNLYNYDSKRWVDAYSLSVNNFAITNRELNKLQSAEELFLNNLNTRKKLYEQIPERWEYIYSQSLINKSIFYLLNDNLNNSISLINEALTINKKLYFEDSNTWIEGYSKALNIKGYSLYAANNYEDALDVEKESLTLRENLYRNHNKRWIELYLISLISITLSNYLHENFKTASDYHGKFISLFELVESEYLIKLFSNKFEIFLATNFNNLGLDKNIIKTLKKQTLELELSHKQSPYRWSDAFM